VRHILDTHVLVWWLNDDRKLSREHARTIARDEQDGTRIAISAISLWEIAKLVERGKIVLAQAVDEALADVEASPCFEVLPLTSRIAIESTRLGANFPPDPADQLVAATARCHGLTLLTADERILESGVVAAR
jgi:PIN domain nuclease of toxin-antitoxin system